MEALSQPCLGSTSAGLRSEWNGGRQHLPLTPTHLPVSLTRSYDYDPDFIRKGEQQPSSSSDPMQDDPAAATPLLRPHLLTRLFLRGFLPSLIIHQGCDEGGPHIM